MKVKKFVVDSMPDAMKKIRSELGQNAMILNTKKVKTGGFFGLFGRRQIEVIAAVDPNRIQLSQNRAPSSQPKFVTENTSQQTKQTRINDPDSRVHENEKLHEKRVDQAKHKNDEDRDDVMKELQSMKKLMMKVMVGDHSEEHTPKALSKWIARLRDQECDEEVIQFIVEKLMQKMDSLDNVSEHEIQTELLCVIENMVQKGTIVNERQPKSVKIVNLFGPTGVGKTTTIAKLAAEQVLKQKWKVGMLTTDTYRIAAVEQLKTYANILNIPLEVVYSPSDIEKSIDRLKECDLIYMDTAGRNYKDIQYISEVKKYLSIPVKNENVLVLSLTAKPTDIKYIVDNFRSVEVDRLIFTKLDETTSYGTILNVVYHYPYSLSYITNGQSVPEDIMKVNPKRIAKYILGVDANDGGSSPTIERISAETN